MLKKRLSKLDADDIYTDYEAGTEFKTIFPDAGPFIVIEDNEIGRHFGGGISSTKDSQYRVVSSTRLKNLDLYNQEPASHPYSNVKLDEYQYEALSSIFLDKTAFDEPLWVCIYGPYLYGPSKYKHEVIREIIEEFQKDNHLAC